MGRVVAMSPGGGETASEASGWTVETLRAHFAQIFDERDHRYEQRFDAQEKAVAAALSAAERAVAKAELAAEKRFEAVNEFRAQLGDQASTFMPRGEANAETSNLREKIEALTARIDALATRFERGEGQRSGLKDGWGYLVGAAGFISTLIAIAYALSR
jgi:hypothetical protein